jgi:hypothetical protein
MTWIDNEDLWGERGDGRPNSGSGPGRICYWMATTVAALMVIFVIADLFISWAQGQPILRIVALITAVVVWVIGRACRSLA